MKNKILQKLMTREMSRKEFLGLGAFAMASAFGLTGLARELLTHAATPTASTEPETGTLAGSVSVVSDGSASGGAAVRFGAPTVNGGIPLVIFDSDLSSDYDDVGDMAVVEGLALLGECRIIGMAVSSTNGASAKMMDATNTYYGIPGIPIGNRPDVLGDGSYPAQIASEFPHAETSFPLARDMYRQALAASPDGSVIIVTAGYLDNLQALMQSGPDQYSSLNGIDLVRQKVKVWACAGGGYPSGGEFNFTVSPTAAQYVVNNWPTAATFSPDNLGRYYLTGGTLVQMPNNPIRRVYVDIEHNTTGYPCWTQLVIYQSIRGNTGLFSVVNTGSNTVAANGNNQWVASPDPNGAQDQAYLIERARVPVTDGLNALMTLLPRSTAANLNVPGAPSDLKATVVSGSQITLNWVKNSYNETGFVIEKRTSGTSYSQIGTVGAGVTSYAVTGLSATANVGFRVKAVNAAGSSYAYSYIWVYSGWTETNFQTPGQGLPLYTYYQTAALRWNQGGAAYDHISVNNDSNHGQNLTINVLAACQGDQGGLFIYFFYQDPNNWYRLNFDNGGEVINDPNQWNCWFEKSVGGTITQIGSKVSCRNYVTAPWVAPWQVVVSGGNLSFTVGPGGLLSMPSSGTTTLLNVTDTMSFTSGKIGLGGKGMTPVWENFNFY